MKLKFISEKVPNRICQVMGSNAGAGSGEFHMYRMVSPCFLKKQFDGPYLGFPYQQIQHCMSVRTLHESAGSSHCFLHASEKLHKACMTAAITSFADPSAYQPTALVATQSGVPDAKAQRGAYIACAPCRPGGERW